MFRGVKASGRSGQNEGRRGGGGRELTVCCVLTFLALAWVHSTRRARSVPVGEVRALRESYAERFPSGGVSSAFSMRTYLSTFTLEKTDLSCQTKKSENPVQAPKGSQPSRPPLHGALRRLRKCAGHAAHKGKRLCGVAVFSLQEGGRAGRGCWKGLCEKRPRRTWFSGACGHVWRRIYTLAAVFRSATASVCSQVNSGSSRPKWP